MHQVIEATIVQPSEFPGRRLGRLPPLREMLAVLLLVVLADLLFYRGHGYSGYAAFFVVAPLLLLLGGQRHRFGRGAGLILAGLLLLAARMVWLGVGDQLVLDAWLLVALTLAARGRRPYVLQVIVHGFQSVIAGGRAWFLYVFSALRSVRRAIRLPWLSLLVPLVVLSGFALLFVLANPDLREAIAQATQHLGQWLEDWTRWLDLSDAELLLWALVAWLAAGLLRPIAVKGGSVSFSPRRRKSVADRLSPLYGAWRNTLLAVIALFAVYLVFEYRTLWFRDFPIGFYYGGYAHEGAAWLTAALALATLVLSLVFQGATFHDPRLRRLKWLAWIWSAENFVLAMAVYHRMLIYIDFNGMTRMRTIGLFGISAVVVGFVLVIAKIVRQTGFMWLVNRQLWTLATAVFVLALTPVDALVHAYNVRRILAGEPAPSVQITVHPIDAEGYLVLTPLVDCRDPVIREGIRAMLAKRQQETDRSMGLQRQNGWTAFQGAERLLDERLSREADRWQDYSDPFRREEAIRRFKDYAYQWY